ncbi:hypothetical protein BKA82DRAFT_4458248 [Pisolithus tinctorius]|nr:hypothetical protein BKA82DRAFT_4458248 [Pisolithus tinctorius]
MREKVWRADHGWRPGQYCRRLEGGYLAAWPRQGLDFPKSDRLMAPSVAVLHITGKSERWRAEGIFKTPGCEVVAYYVLTCCVRSFSSMVLTPRNDEPGSRYYAYVDSTIPVRLPRWWGGGDHRKQRPARAYYHRQYGPVVVIFVGGGCQNAVVNVEIVSRREQGRKGAQLRETIPLQFLPLYFVSALISRPPQRFGVRQQHKGHSEVTDWRWA